MSNPYESERMLERFISSNGGVQFGDIESFITENQLHFYDGVVEVLVEKMKDGVIEYNEKQRTYVKKSES